MTTIWGDETQIDKHVERIFGTPENSRDIFACVLHGMAHTGQQCAEMALPDFPEPKS